MPESRKRPGAHYETPADIPAKQRTHATILLGVLLAVFAALIAWFAGAGNRTVLAWAIGGFVIGFIIGKAMERNARHK